MHTLSVRLIASYAYASQPRPHPRKNNRQFRTSRPRSMYSENILLTRYNLHPDLVATQNMHVRLAFDGCTLIAIVHIQCHFN